MRAMAILYIGPHLNPDFASDYHISPILTPPQILAKFPPLLLQCGEKDPLVDDTIIFAGRVREAKRQRLEELRGMLAKGRSDMDSAELQTLEDELESLDVESDDAWWFWERLIACDALIVSSGSLSECDRVRAPASPSRDSRTCSATSGATQPPK